MLDFQVMRSAAVTLDDGIGLWLPYASVQHTLKSKRAALDELGRNLQQELKDHQLLAEKNSRLVIAQVHSSKRSLLPSVNQARLKSNAYFRHLPNQPEPNGIGLQCCLIHSSRLLLKPLATLSPRDACIIVRHDMLVHVDTDGTTPQANIGAAEFD